MSLIKPTWFAVLLTWIALCHSLAAQTQEWKLGFENLDPGELTFRQTDLGNLETISGKAEIDDQHAKTGQHCLHLMGGEGTQVVWELSEQVPTDGKLTFWAERWTARSPFQFRIEAKSIEGQWQEIFLGDRQIKVGREFLSQVSVPLGDPSIRTIRFTCISPDGTGILLDDFAFLPAKPQKITDVQVIPMALPALVGKKRPSAILKLKIETEGSLNPISIANLKIDLSQSSDLNDLKSLHVLASQNGNFSGTEQALIEPISPASELLLKPKGTLKEGENYVWLCATLSESAEIDNKVAIRCKSISFSDDVTLELEDNTAIQNLGVAVRNAGDDGVHTFRIPGLATTNQGSLIAVYDIRYRGGGDLPGDIDVGMSRSIDGGRTWEPMRVIMDMGKDPNFRFDGIGDPTILVDRETGTLWVAATWSHGNRSWNGSQPGLAPEETGQFILVKSEDDGRTWSKPINITRQVKKPEWSFLLQGPGKGICMSDGTLVMPAQYQDPPNSENPKANRLPHSTFIYSRDHGQTWKTASGAWDDTTESQVVELADGQLMINCRYNREARRVVMTSNDMGRTWQKHPTNIKTLIEPRACMASLINIGRELGWRKIDSKFGPKDLLFSNPNSLQGRNHITIKYSPDGGATWPSQNQLLLDEQTGAGYSCMSMIDSETVGILYEGSQAHMTFQRIKLKEILEPPMNQKTSNPAIANQIPASNANRQTLGFGRVFGDHMVLQADMPINIWGSSKPNAQVTLENNKSKHLTRADSAGQWKFRLPAEPSSSQPRRINIFCDGESAALNDVVIGDVWLCAGQSNMEWPLSNTDHAALALESADDSGIRLMSFNGLARGEATTFDKAQLASLTPENFCQGEWKISSPETAKDFSGVGYYFGLHVRKEGKRPIGLIDVSSGGTPIEAWIDPSLLAETSSLASILNGNWLDNEALNTWCRERGAQNLQRGIERSAFVPVDEYGPNHPFKPGFMYKSAIAPLAGLSIRGVLWYQGESNAFTFARLQQYETALPLFVKNLRRDFNNDVLPFCLVQLPAMGRKLWPEFREIQLRFLQNMDDQVGLVVSIDTGHPTDVHPTQKKPIGDRLAQWALAAVYQQPNVAMGPLPINNSLKVEGSVAKLSFSQVGRGLRSADEKTLRHFEIAGLDEAFYPAKAKIVSANQIEIQNPLVDAPTYVRYAWSPYPDPQVNLCNSAGIPASPFTTQKDFLHND